MNHSELMTPCCPRCRHTAATPCPDCDRLRRTTVRSVTTTMPAGETRAARLERARRGGDGMLLYVGAGTCGRANGALSRDREDRRVLRAARPARADRRDRLRRLLPARGLRRPGDRPTACASATATSARRRWTSGCTPCSATGSCTTGSCSAATRTRTTCTAACRPIGEHAVLRAADQGRAGELRRHRPGQPRRGAGAPAASAPPPGRWRAMTPAEVCDEVDRQRPARPRRRRLPDRHEVEGRARPGRAARSTSSATPTRATPARSWTAP